MHASFAALQHVLMVPQAIKVTVKECGLPETVTFNKEAQSVLGFAIEQMLCLFSIEGTCVLPMRHAKASKQSTWPLGRHSPTNPKL